MTVKTRDMLKPLMVQVPDQADWEQWLMDSTPAEQYANGKSYEAHEAHKKSYLKHSWDNLRGPSTMDGNEIKKMFDPTWSQLNGFNQPPIYEALYIWERKDYEAAVHTLVWAWRSKRAPHDFNNVVELPTDILMFLHLKAVMIARYWALHVDDANVRGIVLRELGQYLAAECEEIT